jgi:hypothetical protein
MTRLKNVEILPEFGIIPLNPFLTTNFCPARRKKSNSRSSRSRTPSSTEESSETEEESESDFSEDSQNEPEFPDIIKETDRIELWHRLKPSIDAQTDIYFEFVSPLYKRHPHRYEINLLSR